MFNSIVISTAIYTRYSKTAILPFYLAALHPRTPLGILVDKPIATVHLAYPWRNVAVNNLLYIQRIYYITRFSINIWLFSSYICLETKAFLCNQGQK